MAKAAKRAFVCNECGADYPRWQGQCSACHAWNSITEVRLAAARLLLAMSALSAMPAMPASAEYKSFRYQSGRPAAFLYWFSGV